LPATRRADLRGRTATPGLIDSHAHVADAGVEQLYHVHLGDASTIADVVRRVQAGPLEGSARRHDMTLFNGRVVYDAEHP
jgi:predicted amidohydrolase YtcJ